MEITLNQIRLHISRADITQLEVDGVVNAANNRLLGGAGVDGAIHRAAGPALLDECKTLNGCKTGEAKITAGHKLPASYIIHTVGPVWHGGQQNEAELLASSYRNSLQLAKDYHLNSIAFPALSCGVYGYPVDKAANIAINEIKRFSNKPGSIKDVVLVAFSGEMLDVLETAARAINA